jgi:hypothetical protein
MSNLKTVALGVSLAVASIGAFANEPATPRVDARQVKQEKRIEKGVESGQLTGKEATRLEEQQGHVAAVETRAKADGTVTAAERRHLNRAQNHSSSSIYHQKHDAQTAASAPVKR